MARANRQLYAVGVMGASIVTGATAVMLAVFGAASVGRGRPPLPDFGQVPAFSLLDQERRSVSLDALAGSVWIADFIFTRCAGQCPIMSAQMARLQQEFTHEPGLRLVSFTVDPSHDTPETLALYASQYKAAGSWSFLTGEPDAVTALAQEGFRLGVSEEGSAAEPITHSVRLVLVDQQGHIRGYYDATDAQAVVRLREDARLLLQWQLGS